MTEGSVSRRYARALLELAKEGGLLDRIEADLTRYVELSRSADFGQVMGTPVFTQSERRAVLDAVLPKLALHPLTANFLRLLLDKERLDGIDAIHREFGALVD